MSDVAAHLDHLEACAAEARRLVQGQRDDQINWRAAPDRWSVAECLMHLTETSRIYLPAFAAAIARGRARGRTGSGPFAPSWMGRKFAALLEPPAKARFRAPQRFRPRVRVGAADVVGREYEEANRAVRDVVRSAEGLDLGRVRMTSPLTPLLRFNLEAGFRIHEAHERRHLWQARRVREEPGYPA